MGLPGDVTLEKSLEFKACDLVIHESSLDRAGPGEKGGLLVAINNKCLPPLASTTQEEMRTLGRVADSVEARLHLSHFLCSFANYLLKGNLLM